MKCFCKMFLEVGSANVRIKYKIHKTHKSTAQTQNTNHHPPLPPDPGQLCFGDLGKDFNDVECRRSFANSRMQDTH